MNVLQSRVGDRCALLINLLEVQLDWISSRKTLGHSGMVEDVEGLQKQINEEQVTRVIHFEYISCLCNEYERSRLIE